MNCFGLTANLWWVKFVELSSLLFTRAIVQKKCTLLKKSSTLNAEDDHMKLNSGGFASSQKGTSLFKLSLCKARYAN